MEIKLNCDDIKELIREVVKETMVNNLESYETLITAEDNDSRYYQVFYKGIKLQNVSKIVLDNRILKW